MKKTGAALGEERRLIFENVANGLPIADVMATFSRSQLEVDLEVKFVAKKIREYRWRRRIPPLQCETIMDIRWNRRALLDTLAKLGPLYLSTELLIPKVGVQMVTNRKELKEAAQAVRVFDEP